MSLESGRRLGFIASMINILAPIISIVLLVALFIGIIAGIVSGISSGGRLAAAPVLSSFVIVGAIISLAIIALVAIILFLLAMNQLSQHYQEPGIFKNALYGFLVNIIGGAASIAVFFAVAVVFRTIATSTAPSTAPASLSIFGTLIIVGIVGFALAIVSGIFYMRAFHLLAEKSGVDSFSTAGTLYIIGAVLQVVLIGALLIWIAWIFAAIGFRRLKPKPTDTGTFRTTPLSTPVYSSQKVICPQCGTENSANSTYCWSCGKPLPRT